jgi:MFS family permease
MKTAVWIYLFLFVAFFDLHAQFPMLSPFALSLGAAPSFIGLIMGIYSITHIPGNLIAGYGIDRYGSKLFIAISLIAAGALLLWQSQVTNPWQLLVIRSISGFILAFLSPACSALLAGLAKNLIQQGQLMSGKGLVQTLASVVSPAVGALLVAKIGFQSSFILLGIVLIAIGLAACFFIQDLPRVQLEKSVVEMPKSSFFASIPWTFYSIPLALSCSQGILFFELPLIPEQSIMTSGLLFSIVSIGALCTLSLLFLNRYSPALRNIIGIFALALIFYAMAVRWPLPFVVYLFLIGACKGLLYPAIATFLTSISKQGEYGKVFSMLSISYSVGAFLGPVLAGNFREILSPYYIAFLVLMLSSTLFPYGRFAVLPLFKREQRG